MQVSIQIADRTPPFLYCIPFIGPMSCIYVIPTGTDADRLMAVRRAIRAAHDTTPPPPLSEISVRRLKNWFNKVEYGIVGGITTLASIIGLAVLGIITLSELTSFGLLWIAGTSAIYYVRHQARKEFRSAYPDFNFEFSLSRPSCVDKIMSVVWFHFT